MNGASDEELLAAHLRGDQAAFGELVSRHERRIYGLCLRVLGNREDAEDATQEAFLSALRRAGAFRGEAAFSTWLFRIAINAATDQARRRGRTRTVPLEPDEAGPGPGGSGGGGGGGDPSGAVATAVAVRAALREVPEEYRVALVLCDLYGLPYAEAAAVMEVPIGTVKSRVFRGRLALAELLEPGARAARRAGGGPAGAGTPGHVRASERTEQEHPRGEE